MSKLLFPPNYNPPNQNIESQKEEPKKQNQNNILPEVQNDQPYMLPPPQTNSAQNQNNIPNEQNQNLLDHGLINQAPSDKRLKLQCRFSLILFMYAVFSFFNCFIFLDFDSRKDKEKIPLLILLGTATVLMIIVGILMVIKAKKKKTTRTKVIFILSLITSILYLAIIIYSFFGLHEEIFFMFSFLDFVLMIIVTIYNSQLTCPFDCCN